MKIKRSANRRVVAETEVAPEATELLFETTDVAELVAEITGEDVEVEATEDAVDFTVGEETFSVVPEEETEVLESVRIRGKKTVKASTSTRKPAPRRVTRRR